MLEDIADIKSKLAQLAPLLNSFKSEAVQLKLLEIIVGPGFSSNLKGEANNAAPKSSGKRKRKSKVEPQTHTGATGSAKPPGKKKAVGSGSGAHATLNQLAQTDFFSKPRTINDIVQHCKDNLARTFKANEISGKLGRMVRDNELKRTKNKDGQYEYQKA